MLIAAADLVPLCTHKDDVENAVRKLLRYYADESEVTISANEIELRITPACWSELFERYDLESPCHVAIQLWDGKRTTMAEVDLSLIGIEPATSPAWALVLLDVELKN